MDIIVPKLYEDMQSAIFRRWEKNVGDTVDSQDILFIIETEKSVFEIEAEDDGILRETSVSEGDVVKTLQVIGQVE